MTDRVADLIRRFGYGEVEAAVARQKPKPRKRGSRGPQYSLEDDLQWLLEAKRCWAGLADSGGCGQTDAEALPTILPRAPTAGTTRGGWEPEVLIRHGLMEMANALGDGHPFPSVPATDALSAWYRAQTLKFHKKLCGFLAENSGFLQGPELNDQILDLMDIVGRLDVDGRLCGFVGIPTSRIADSSDTIEDWRERASKYHLQETTDPGPV